MLNNRTGNAVNKEQVKEKQIPTFLKPDYPYKAVEEAIIDLDSLKPDGVYEIKCPKCDMAIRSQGKNIRTTYERLKNAGCIGCGNKDLIIRYVSIRAEELNTCL